MIAKKCLNIAEKLKYHKNTSVQTQSLKYVFDKN